jgi:5-methylcytosine-specific restriction endonuclease McrA
MRNVMHSPVLVLNSSYEPLHVCSARRALTLVVKEVALIQHDTGSQVHAGIMFPSVIRLKQYRRVPHRAQRLTRKNILVRDGHQCQYCGEMFSAMVLTLDHVIPRSKGGLSEWSNLVAACSDCNRRKADRTPEEANMPILRRPRPVTLHTARGLLRAEGHTNATWQKYLYFDNKGCREGVTQG